MRVLKWILLVAILGLWGTETVWAEEEKEEAAEEEAADKEKDEEKKEEEKDKGPKFAKVIKDFDKIEGLFELYRDPEENKVFLAIRPDQFQRQHHPRARRATRPPRHRQRGHLQLGDGLQPGQHRPRGPRAGRVLPTLGPYDYWAIEYAYRPVEADSPASEQAQLAKIAGRVAKKDLAYGTDEDAIYSGRSWRRAAPSTAFAATCSGRSYKN